MGPSIRSPRCAFARGPTWNRMNQGHISVGPKLVVTGRLWSLAVIPDCEQPFKYRGFYMLIPNFPQAAAKIVLLSRGLQMIKAQGTAEEPALATLKNPTFAPRGFGRDLEHVSDAECMEVWASLHSMKLTRAQRLVHLITFVAPGISVADISAISQLCASSVRGRLSELKRLRLVSRSTDCRRGYSCVVWSASGGTA